MFSGLQKNKLWIIIGSILLIGFSFAVFGRSLTQGFAAIDDNFVVVNNLAIRGLTLENLKTIFTTYDPELYIPFTLLSFQLNYLINGLDPFYFHLVNLLLHGFNAILVWWLLNLISKRPILAFIAAVIFVVHPIQTQTVVWITGRKDLLMTFFWLLSFISYIKYRQGSKSAYSLSLVLFFCSLLSKFAVFTFPVILILYDLIIEHRQISLKSLADKLPFILFSVVFVFIAQVRKERYLEDTNFIKALILSGKSILFYIQRTCWPSNISVFYPYRTAVNLLKPEVFISNLTVTGSVLLSIFAYFNNKKWIFGWLLFLVMVSPTLLNSSPTGTPILGADRYIYAPLVGLLFMIILWLQTVRLEPPKMLFWTLNAFVIVILSITAFNYTKTWDSAEIFFAYALKKYPESVTARTGYAKILREQGRYQEVFEVLKDGLRLGNDMELHLAAGALYAKTRNIQDAAEQFNIAIQMKPEHPEPYFYLASLKDQTGQTNEAVKLYEKAIELDETYVIARTKIARLYRLKGEKEKAYDQLITALNWNKNSFEGHIEMAKLLIDEEKKDEARKHFLQAREIDPYNSEIRELEKKIEEI